jgi:ribosomal protein L7/L12
MISREKKGWIQCMGILDFLFKKRALHDLRPAGAFSIRKLEEMIRNGNRIEAIKMVRLYTGEGLKVAKDFVDYFEACGFAWMAINDRFPQMARKLDSAQPGDLFPGEAPGSIPAPSHDRFSAADRARIEALLREDQLIQAIKLIREISGLGLKEAKDMAESIKRAL